MSTPIYTVSEKRWSLVPHPNVGFLSQYEILQQSRYIGTTKGSSTQTPLLHLPLSFRFVLSNIPHLSFNYSAYINVGSDNHVRKLFWLKENYLGRMTQAKDGSKGMKV
jgi:hypothetical protein